MPRQPIKQDRAHETRTRIVHGSASAFADNGYSGATIAEILERSSATKGALYFHFETKEDVAKAVLEAHAVWLAAAAETVRGRGLQGVIDLTYLFADALISDDVLRAAARLSVDRETFALSQDPSFLQWERLCVEILDEADAQRMLVPGVDVAAVARVAMTMLLGAHLASLVADGGRSGVHAEMQKFWRITLPGVATPDALACVNVAFTNISHTSPAAGEVPSRA